MRAGQEIEVVVMMDGQVARSYGGSSNLARCIHKHHHHHHHRVAVLLAWECGGLCACPRCCPCQCLQGKQCYVYSFLNTLIAFLILSNVRFAAIRCGYILA